MELLLSRYIIEEMKDNRLFKLYSEGKWYPDFTKYKLFINKQERNNKSFAKLIERYHLIKTNDHVVESVFSKEINSITSYLNINGTMIYSNYGNMKNNANAVKIDLEPFTCYISNGFFNDTRNIALKQINRGNFIIGVCDNPNTIFYRENIIKIRCFEQELHKKHINYKKYEHTNHRDKCIILSYKNNVL